MERFYVLYRIATNFKEVVVEEFEADNALQAKEKFINKKSYENNNVFDENYYMIMAIMNQKQYSKHKEIEHRYK